MCKICEYILFRQKKRKRNKKNAGNKEKCTETEVYTMDDDQTDVKELILKRGVRAEV